MSPSKRGLPSGPEVSEIRAQLIAARRALALADRDRLSSEAVERFLSESGVAPFQWKDLRVALYRALRSELDLAPLERALIGLGARLCFPKVLSAAEHRMEFVAPPLSEPGTDPSMGAPTWPKGPHGIEAPPEHFRLVDPTSIDVIFVPGVAFGHQGERIGMGAGYYDRYLPSAPQALRVALAFDFQLLPKLEQKPWDQRVDWIWTERRGILLRPWPLS